MLNWQPASTNICFLRTRKQTWPLQEVRLHLCSVAYANRTWHPSQYKKFPVISTTEMHGSTTKTKLFSLLPYQLTEQSQTFVEQTYTVSLIGHLKLVTFPRCGCPDPILSGVVWLLSSKHKTTIKLQFTDIQITW